MARPIKDGGTFDIRLRVSKNCWALIQEIAHLESMHTGRFVTGQELIRLAIHYVYYDNERLREVFRRTRSTNPGQKRKKHCM
jgi:hypothetical protein